MNHYSQASGIQMGRETWEQKPGPTITELQS